MRAWWFSFVLRTDVPGWQLYARRILAPVALGAVIGVGLTFGLSLVGSPWRWWLLLLFAVAMLGWVWRMERELARMRRETFEDMARLAKLVDGLDGEGS